MADITEFPIKTKAFSMAEFIARMDATIVASDNANTYAREARDSATGAGNSAATAVGAATSASTAAGNALNSASSAAAAAALAYDAKQVSEQVLLNLPQFPEAFGAVGYDTDPLADDTDAITAWIAYLRDNGLTGYLTRWYRITKVNGHPFKSYGISGVGDRQCGFMVDNPNRNEVGLNFTHPTNPEIRGKQYQLDNFAVDALPGTKACLVEHRYASADKWDKIRVSGYHGATGVRLEKCWNVDITQLSIWGCGHNITSKDVPDGMTFSIATGGAPLVASGPLFGPEDVGKYFTVAASASTTPQTFLLTEYLSPTEMAVGSPRQRAYTNVPGSFGGIRGSMTTGSKILRLEAARMTDDDIGRKVYVVGAARNGSMARPLPGRVVAVNGVDIELDATAQFDVTLAELVFDPAADFGDNDYTVTQKTNDFNCKDLHVEHHRGCGLVLTGVTLDFSNIKLHASGHDKKNGEATNIQLLAYDAAGWMYGSLQQVVASNSAPFILTGADQILTVPMLEILMPHGRPAVLMKECDDGAALDMGTVKGIGGDQNASAINNCLAREGTKGVLLARLVGAPGQATRRLNVQI